MPGTLGSRPPRCRNVTGCRSSDIGDLMGLQTVHPEISSRSGRSSTSKNLKASSTAFISVAASAYTAVTELLADGADRRNNLDIGGKFTAEDVATILEENRERAPLDTWPQMSLPADGAKATCLAVRPGGRLGLILVGDCKGGVTLWRSDDGDDDDGSPKSFQSRPLQRIVGLEFKNSVSVVCWSPQGDLFAVATEARRERRTEDAPPLVAAYTVHDLQEHEQACGVMELTLMRNVQSMSFCGNGNHLALLESSEFMPSVRFLDLYERKETNSRIVMQSPMRSLSFIAPIVSMAESRVRVEDAKRREDSRSRLCAGMGNDVVLFNCNASRKDLTVEVLYSLTDDTDSIDVENDIQLEAGSLLVASVAHDGPAASEGVKGGKGWLLVGWRYGAKGKLVEPEKLGEVETAMKEMTDSTDPVWLVFQRPVKSKVFLRHGAPVLCTAVSPHAQCLAVGGRVCGSLELRAKDNSSSKVTLTKLSLWSLETCLCQRRIDFRKDIRSLNWVGPDSLLVGHGDCLTVLNSSSGGAEYSWNFTRLVEFAAASPDLPWAAVTLGATKSSPQQIRLCFFEGGNSDALLHLEQQKIAKHNLFSCAANGDAIAAVDQGSRRLRVWFPNVGGFRRDPMSIVDGAMIWAVSLSADGALLAACYFAEAKSWVKVFLTNATEPTELSRDSHDDKFACVVICNCYLGAGSRGRAVLAAAGSGRGRSKGRVGWLRERGKGDVPLPSNINSTGVAAGSHLVATASLEGGPDVSDVTALAISLSGCWLACARRSGAVQVFCVATEGKVDLIRALQTELPLPIQAIALGTSGEASDVVNSSFEAQPPLVACGSASVSKITIQETATGVVRHVIDTTFTGTSACDVETEDDWRRVDKWETLSERPAGVTSLQFASDGSCLVGGCRSGGVSLVDLGSHSSGALGTRRLALGGCVCGLAFHGPRLGRALCLPGEEPDKVLLYDLTTPSLAFMLPDLQNLSAAQLAEQLMFLPQLAHQRLLRDCLDWTLLHWAAARGSCLLVRTLIGFKASAVTRDYHSRNAFDVALQHYHLGVVEELMQALSEETRAGGSVGADLLARALPDEHYALTRTVVRLLGFRLSGLDKFIDFACSGPPLVPDNAEAPPFRAALRDGERRVTTSTTSAYVAQDMDLLPVSSGDSRQAQDGRPIEIRVWYLQGALERKVGMLHALMAAPYHEALRTRFAGALLYYKWKSFARGRFLMGLLLYLFYLASFGVWTLVSSRDEYRASLQFSVLQITLAVVTGYYFLEEALQFSAEEKKINYFNIWNIIDLLRLGSVSFLLVNGLAGLEDVTARMSRGVLAFAALLVWAKLLSFGRGFPHTGHLVRTLVSILLDMRIFMLLVLLLIFGFMHAFFALCGLRADVQSTLSVAMFVYHEGVIGELVDLGSCSMNSPESFALYVLLTLSMLVVMLNFLIAIMSESFQHVHANAETARNLMRAELIWEVEEGALLKGASPAQGAYIFELSELERGSWRSESEGNQVEERLGKQQDQLGAIEGRVKALSDRMYSVEANLCRGLDRVEHMLQDLQAKAVRCTEDVGPREIS